MDAFNDCLLTKTFRKMGALIVLIVFVALLAFNQRFFNIYNDRNFSVSNFHRGNLLLNDGQFDEALVYYDKAISVPDPNPMAVIGTAMKYLYVYESYGQSAQLFTSVVSVFQSDPSFWRHYGKALEMSDDLFASTKALKIAEMLARDQ